MNDLAINMVVAGIFATVMLDIWQRVLYAATGIPPTNWGMIGRWFGHMKGGRLMHVAIGDAAPVANEATIGWIMHYLIGLAYGVVYVGLMVAQFGAPTLLNGFLFGLASVVIPWFLMQPCLGIGIMGAKASNPNIPRYSALAAHCIYGVALYVGSATHTVLAG